MKESYEKPEVTKVDFKFDEAIAASSCDVPSEYYPGSPTSGCLE